MAATESMVGIHEPTFLSTDILKTLGSTGVIIMAVGVFLLAILLICTIALTVWYCKKSSLEKSDRSTQNTRLSISPYTSPSREGTLSTHPRLNPSAPTLSPRSQASTGIVGDDDIIVVTSSDDHSDLQSQERGLQLDTVNTPDSSTQNPPSDGQNRTSIYL